jgi:hypothetical protein
MKKLHKNQATNTTKGALSKTGLSEALFSNHTIAEQRYLSFHK